MINGQSITLGSQVVSSSTIRVETIGPPRITSSRQIMSSTLADRATLADQGGVVVKSREASPVLVFNNNNSGRRQHVIDLRPATVYNASAIRVDFNTPMNVQCKKIAEFEKCALLGESGRGYTVTIEPISQEGDLDRQSPRDFIQEQDAAQTQAVGARVADNFSSSGIRPADDAAIKLRTNHCHMAYVPRRLSSTSLTVAKSPSRTTPASEAPAQRGTSAGEALAAQRQISTGQQPARPEAEIDPVVSSTQSVHVIPRGAESTPSDFINDQRVLRDLSTLMTNGLAVEAATATCLEELKEAYPAYFK